MSYSQEDRDIIMSGWEEGIFDNPYEGIYDMRNVDNVTIPGEVSIAMKTQRTDTLNTAITNVAFTVDNTTDIFTYSGTPALQINTAIRFTNSGGALPSGLDATKAYYIKTTPTPTTFTIATSAGGTQQLVSDDGSGTNTFTVINMGTPTEIKPLTVPLVEVGDIMGGGIVFYLLKNGDTGYDPTVQKGLIVSSTDVSAGVYWHATNDTSVTTNTAIGTGQANTTAIITAYGAEVNAAKTCDTYTSGSFSDWYLPSKDELNELYLVKTNPNINITTGAYWTSSQYSSSQGYAQSFDTGFQGGINKSSTQPVRAIRSFAVTGPIAQAQSSYVAVDNNGRVWIYQSGVNDYWIYLNNLASELTTNTYNNIICWKGYIFLFQGVNLGYLQYNTLASMSLKTAWNLTWKTSLTIANIHKALVGQDDILYFCNDIWVGSIIEIEGELFDPTSATTYTYNPRVLGVLSFDKTTCIGEIGSDMLIGGQNNLIYIWDRLSAQYRGSIFLSENYTYNIVTMNNTAYLFTGHKGRIFITNGGQATPFWKIPEYLTGTTNPYILWKDANYNRNQLYFSFSITKNDGTVINELGGLWAVNVDTSTPTYPRLQNQMSYGTYTGYVSALCQFRGADRSSAPSNDGYGLFIGWYNGTSGGIDKGISTPYTGGESYIILDPINVGQLKTKRTFENLEFKLGAPLVSGESVALYYRTDLSASWTNVPITSGGGTGDVSGLSDTVNFENAQWIQIKVVLNGTATTPSFIRLREIRLR